MHLREGEPGTYTYEPSIAQNRIVSSALAYSVGCGAAMKLVIGLLVVVLLYLQYSAWLGNHGVIKLWQLQRTIASQQAENKGLRERNQKLHAEVVDLKQGTDALEERARSELGMIKKGEMFYQVIDQNRPPDPRAR